MFPAALMQEGKKAVQDDVKHEIFPAMPWYQATPPPTNAPGAQWMGMPLNPATTTTTPGPYTFTPWMR